MAICVCVPIYSADPSMDAGPQHHACPSPCWHQGSPDRRVWGWSPAGLTALYSLPFAH